MLDSKGQHFLTHAHLISHKGLNDAILQNLEKMNVICGPNSSGKTTVLECVATTSLHTVGISISEQIAQEIAAAGLRGGSSWGRSNEHLDQTYIRLVQEALMKRRVWFSDQYNQLESSIDWSFGDRWANPSASLKQAFAAQFPPSPSVILVPAKRSLESEKQVNAFEPIGANGGGILNFLFAAKNRDESSNERIHFKSICEAFGTVSGGYEFDIYIKPSKGNPNSGQTIIELQFRRRGGAWIHAADCGLGLQELIIILYFAIASPYTLILVEEPENHLHPEIQRRLIAFLKEQTEKQFLVSTHSSIFLNTLFADRVFICRFTDSIKVENATSRALALTELGYSIADNLISDLVVLCEGPRDKIVLEEFFHKMGLTEQKSIRVWPLGGDIMDQLDLSVFLEAHRLIALIDNDPGSSQVRKRFVEKCNELGIPVTRLERYSIENYFSMAAIASIMKGQMNLSIEKIDPDVPVGDQLGFDVKKNGGRIAKAMSLKDVEGTDFDAFLKQVATMLS